MSLHYRDLPLNSKLRLALMLSSSIAATLLFALMLANTIYNLRKESVSQISTLTEVIATNSASALVFSDPKSATDTLAALRVRPEIMFAEIHDRSGTVFASYRSPAASVDYVTHSVFRNIDNNHFLDPTLSISRSIVVDMEPVGEVRVVADLSGMWSIAAEQSIALVIATIISLGLTLMIAERFRTLITAPIEQVANTAKAIAHDQDFSRRVPQGGNDEIGELITAFNQMVEQIEDREARLKDELQHRKAAEHELEKLAHYDTLTGLPNRYMFQQALELTLERARKLRSNVALLFIDLDNFKVVNDSLGHATGDTLLKIISQRLTQCVRSSDIVSRLGGDEFTVIIDQAKGMEHLRNIADKLTRTIAQTVDLQNVEFQLTASTGIALFPQDATDADNLLRNADTAMYSAKSLGRSNFQFFSTEMNERANRRFIVESHLRHALDKNELFLVYQPQIDLGTGKIVGSEALLRWASPELGNIGPDEFIPVAEESGLIQQIGEYVLESACAQTRRWLDEGVEMRIAVNVSIRQFGAKQFVGSIQAVLDRTGLPVDQLELELTESSIMTNVEDTLIKIRRLRELGIHLSVDDFGTGYSSMSYLKQLPVSQLKVDQSFVRNVPLSNEDVEIVRAILHLAQGLGLETLAEGVETVEQARFLAEEGCMLAQGYYFSRPVSVDDMTALLREGRTYTWQ